MADHMDDGMNNGFLPPVSSPQFARGGGSRDDDIGAPLGVTNKWSVGGFRNGCKSGVVSASTLKQATGMTPNAISRLNVGVGGHDTPTLRRLATVGRLGRMGGVDSRVDTGCVPAPGCAWLACA